jgi:hypothetical protein
LSSKRNERILNSSTNQPTIALKFAEKFEDNMTISAVITLTRVLLLTKCQTVIIIINNPSSTRTHFNGFNKIKSLYLGGGKNFHTSLKMDSTTARDFSLVPGLLSFKLLPTSGRMRGMRIHANIRSVIDAP